MATARRRRTRAGRLQRRLARVDLLIIDELGFVPFDRHGGELLFNAIADRYERKSVLVTSTLAFSEWPKVFADDEKLTMALLDRLAHHAGEVEVGLTNNLGWISFSAPEAHVRDCLAGHADLPEEAITNVSTPSVASAVGLRTSPEATRSSASTAPPVAVWWPWFSGFASNLVMMTSG